MHPATTLMLPHVETAPCSSNRSVVSVGFLFMFIYTLCLLWHYLAYLGFALSCVLRAVGAYSYRYPVQHLLYSKQQQQCNNSVVLYSDF